MKNCNLLEIDKKIFVIDKVICRHIKSFGKLPRGIVSQDILSHLRNFVEHIMLKFYANDQDIEINYENICKGINYVKGRGDLLMLRRFHDYLQVVASHYTLDEENSERLMLKYFEYLIKMKKLIKDKFDLNVLENLEKFPLETDSSLKEYYTKIAFKVEKYDLIDVVKSDKYYIRKIKPFFINEQIYYEVTFTPANDYSSKFNRFIAYSKLDISDFYSVMLSLENDNIEILDKELPIIIINGWKVAIRACEFRNFSRLIRGVYVSTSYGEQKAIAHLLTSTGYNLTEIVNFNDERFQTIKQKVTKKVKKTTFFNDLESCRYIIKTNGKGNNLLRYLLYNMNNRVIKNQINTFQNSNLSGLYVQNGCIPFESIPLNKSLIGHNPRLFDLFSCIDTTDRQHELLARLIRNNTEIKGQLFTPIKDINNFDNIESLVSKYNSILWHGHLESSELVIEKGHIFISGYKNDTHYIIEKLKNLADSGVQNYSNSAVAWLNEANNKVDCNEKKDAIIRMFEKSKVALIYGSAGTGKSTLIDHLAHLFADKDKLMLAHTNPAVDNLKRRVDAARCTFSTITRFLSRQGVNTHYDLLVLDECSTVSNTDMRRVIDKVTFKLLVLVGDTYQISSIRFGNWFSVARAFVPETSVVELTEPYRSDNDGLLVLWEKVRVMDETVLEFIAQKNYSTNLNASIFSPTEEDEIILCLNYDGLYGINSINRLLQENNSSTKVVWGIQQYKINDPILFNESERFSPVIYNNLKGRIIGIVILDEGQISEFIQFDIEVEKVINGIDAYGQDFELVGNTEKGNSIIRFYVDSVRSTDEDDESSSKAIVPFQVAYAVSIHKAQGLEYNSVKIVITEEIDELITHNIFYTAITRAKKKLKIYWTPEVEKMVLSSIKPKNNRKDVVLLSNYY